MGESDSLEQDKLTNSLFFLVEEEFPLSNPVFYYYKTDKKIEEFRLYEQGVGKDLQKWATRKPGGRLRKIGKFFFSTELNWTEALSVNIW